MLGFVQSGKTANFSAAFAKAADTGFQLVIVLSGATNALRGRRKGDSIRIGRPVLGRLDPPDLRRLDFRIGKVTPAAASLTTGQPLFAVVKKNAAVLNRLKMVVRGAARDPKPCPALVIDDEADQASINTGSGDTDRPAVNTRILGLLVYAQVAYVGYTATPFANVFIDPTIPEDLYPRDFIVDLPRPPSTSGRSGSSVATA